MEQAVVAAVALLAVLVYANSLANGFALDDGAIILNNPRVHSLDNVHRFFYTPYWTTAPEGTGLYRPITLLTYALDWQLWNGDATGFHLVNVLLHAGVTTLVFLLLRGFGTSLLAAGVAAALFAVHPVHVEAVANVVGRAELLAAFFFLLGVVAHGRGRGDWRTAAVVGAAYLLALGAKEIAVMLPAALVLLDSLGATRLRDVVQRVRRRGRVYVAAAASLVVYMAARKAAAGVFVGGATFSPWFWREPWTTPVLTLVRLWWEYLRLMVFPAQLAADYGPAVIVPERGVSLLVIAGLSAGVLALGVAIAAWKKARLVSAGIGWFMVTILPVSGIFFPLEIILAERTLYLPSVGVSLAVAGLLELVRRGRRRWVPAVVVVLVVLGAAGMVRTWTRTPVWRNTVTVLAALARNHPDSYRNHWVLARELQQRQQNEEALEHYATALALAPGYGNLRSEYAVELLNQEAYAHAAAHFDTLMTMLPDAPWPGAYRLDALIGTGAAQQAVEEGQELVTRFPEGWGLHHNLSRALARVGRWEEAVAARQSAIRTHPGPVDWGHWANLAALHLMEGDTAAARQTLARARHLAPNTVETPSSLDLRRALERGDTTAIPYW